MSDVQGSSEGEVDEVHRRLDTGLKSCRMIVDDYRARMLGDGPEEPPSGEDDSRA